MSDTTTTEVRRVWWVADDAIEALFDVAAVLPDPPRDMVRTRALRLRERLGPAVGERP